ncbi:hypothetical protein SprV_0200860500 [Sparganum proliferum]
MGAAETYTPSAWVTYSTNDSGKTTGLEVGSSLSLPYSPELAPTDYHFFRNLGLRGCQRLSPIRFLQHRIEQATTENSKSIDNAATYFAHLVFLSLISYWTTQ